MVDERLAHLAKSADACDSGSGEDRRFWREPEFDQELTRNGHDDRSGSQKGVPGPFFTRPRSEERPREDVGVELARDEPAEARLGVQPAVLDDDAAAQDRRRRPARDRPALPRAVVAVVVQVVHRDRALDVRIPEDEVGVAARRDHALARVEPGDARRVRREDLDEAPQREAALAPRPRRSR